MRFFRWTFNLTEEVVGDYRLGATIGQGSFGTVREAEHVRTGQRVAVKIVDNKKMDRDKLQEEIRIQRLLDHPHVVRIYDVIETDCSIFIVMELVGGGELFDHIVKKVKLSDDEARRVFQQIIYGVDHCHRRKVVHRDLKPENILVDADLNLKIADFGFAAEMRASVLFTESCGSPNYAAPELLNRSCKYEGPEVDVWSCGIMLYALLCGTLPFDADGLKELFTLIKKGTFKIPGFVSAEAGDLLRKILTLDPAKRLSISQIRRHSWFRESIPEALPDVHSGCLLDTLVVDKSSEQNMLVLSALLAGFGLSSAMSELCVGSRAGKFGVSPSCKGLDVWTRSCARNSGLSMGSSLSMLRPAT